MILRMNASVSTPKRSFPSKRCLGPETPMSPNSACKRSRISTQVSNDVSVSIECSQLLTELVEAVVCTELKRIRSEVAANAEQLDKLQRVRTLINKHPSGVLDSLSDKWLSVAQEALMEIHKRNEEAKRGEGQSASLASIIDHLNIPHDLIRFNAHTEDFY